MNRFLLFLSSLLILTNVPAAPPPLKEPIQKLTFDQMPTEDSPWFYHRMTAARRGAKLLEEGGSDATEKSVMLALRWLKSKQAIDGSWSETSSDGAATGLAVLAFLGHGETPAAPEFGSTIHKALEFLAALVDEDGAVEDSRTNRHRRKTDRTADGGHENANMYVQAIVTEALAEGYGMTQCEGLRYPMERACAFIIKAQAAPKYSKADEGGWRYTPLDSSADLSVSSWQIMALKLGRHASSSVPRALLEKALAAQWSFRVLERNPLPIQENTADATGQANGQKGLRPVFFVPNEVFDKAQQYLWSQYGNPGFGYGFPGTTPSMTAVGVFCSYLLGCSSDPRVTPALGYLAKQSLKDNHEAYRLYFATQAAFQGGPAHWQAWNKQLKNDLLPFQAIDGHWQKLGGWIPSDVMTTAIGAMIFESYYRYPRLNPSGEYSLPDENP